jgi:hypothetical protein
MGSASWISCSWIHPRSKRGKPGQRFRWASGVGPVVWVRLSDVGLRLRWPALSINAIEDGLDDLRFRVDSGLRPSPSGRQSLRDSVLTSLRCAAVGWSKRSAASSHRTWDKPAHRWRRPGAAASPTAPNAAGSSCRSESPCRQHCGCKCRHRHREAPSARRASAASRWERARRSSARGQIDWNSWPCAEASPCATPEPSLPPCTVSM